MFLAAYRAKYQQDWREGGIERAKTLMENERTRGREIERAKGRNRERESRSSGGQGLGEWQMLASY